MNKCETYYKDEKYEFRIMLVTVFRVKIKKYDDNYLLYRKM